MKILLFLLSGLCLIISCTTEKVLLKKNVIYKYSTGTSPEGSPVDVATPYEVVKTKKVKLTDNGTYIIVKDDPEVDTVHYKPKASIEINSKESTAWKRETGNNAYFVEGSDKNGKMSLWYRDVKFVLQTASIPIKIRSAIRTQAYKDTFPSQVETGFNVGFLTGGKITWNRYRKDENIFGQKTDKFSLTGGIILSGGAVDLSATTTRPKIEFPRKAAMLSYGGAFVIGINSINIGYAFGWDNPFGTKASTWVYKGKMWNGIIVSLDLIK